MAPAQKTSGDFGERYDNYLRTFRELNQGRSEDATIANLLGNLGAAAVAGLAAGRLGEPNLPNSPHETHEPPSVHFVEYRGVYIDLEIAKAAQKRDYDGRQFLEGLVLFLAPCSLLLLKKLGLL